jgi:hypothetical protein
LNELTYTIGRDGITGLLLALFNVGSASSETMEITLLAGGSVRRIATQQEPVLDRDFGGIIGARTCKR